MLVPSFESGSTRKGGPKPSTVQIVAWRAWRGCAVGEAGLGHLRLWELESFETHFSRDILKVRFSKAVLLIGPHHRWMNYSKTVLGRRKCSFEGRSSFLENATMDGVGRLRQLP